MNYKLRVMLVEIMDILQKFIVAYTIITVSLYHINESAALYNLGLLPIPFISYLIQKKTKHFWSFFLLHLCIYPIYILTTFHWAAIFLFCLYIGCTTLLSYFGRHRTIGRNSLFLLLVFLVLYWGAMATGMTYLVRFTFYMMIFYILSCMITLYLENFNRYIRNNSETKNIPYQQIRNTNNNIILFLGSSMVLSMIMFYRLPLNPLLAGVGRALVRMIGYLFSFISFSETSQEEAPTQENEMFSPYFEPSPILEIIKRIIEVLMFVATVAVILAVIVFLLYKFYGLFYKAKKQNTNDVIEFISPFTKKESVKRESGRSFFQKFKRSNNGLIRKYFYKEVTSSLKDNEALPQHLTPLELTEFIKLKGIGNDSDIAAQKRDQLAYYYDKARYSNEECSKEEVKKVKELLR